MACEKRERMKDEVTASGELAPCLEENGHGDGETPVASKADEVFEVMFAWKRSLKGVVRLKLDEAFYVAMKAVWAQPMRFVAVCRRFFEYIGRKTGSDRFHLVAACVRLKLIELEEFFLKRVAFFNDALMLVDEAKFRRLMFKQFSLDVKQGRIGLDAVRHAYNSLEAVKDSLKRLCCIRGAGGYCCYVHGGVV